MNSLRSYISMVEPRMLLHINGTVKRFIEVFLAQNYVSEEAFMHEFCGDTRDINHYYNIKKRAVEILQALAIISNSYGVSTVQKKFDLCQKKFVIGQKSIAKGDRIEGVYQIKEAYKIATEYDFTHLSCELASILYHHHVYYKPHKRKVAFYESQTELHLHNYLAEKRAEHRFYHIINKASGSLRLHHIEEAIASAKKYTGNSTLYIAYTSMMKVYLRFQQGDFVGVVTVCQQTLAFFVNKKGVYISHHLFFLRNIGKAQMLTGAYAEASKSFTQAEAFVTSKSVNGYVLRLYKTLNCLHSGDYHRAYELYKQNRKCRFENIKEQFAIIEAYLCFLSHMGHLELKHPFRLGKYLNDTFAAQADKEGSNIAILIAELLVYLGRDRGKFIDRIEAVQNYSYRHLKSTDTRRAKRFIKILCMLPKVNFHAVALQRNATRHIKYLDDHPISVGENVAIEVLPFEVVLDMILTKLHKRGVA